MRYEKISQIIFGGNIGLRRTGVAFFCFLSNCCFLVIFFKKYCEKVRKDFLKGLNRHVEGKVVDVGRNCNGGSMKWFKSGEMAYKVERKRIDGDRNYLEGDRIFFNVEGKRVMGRGKWNDGSIKCVDVKGKCFIVSKKTK